MNGHSGAGTPAKLCSVAEFNRSGAIGVAGFVGNGVAESGYISFPVAVEGTVCVHRVRAVLAVPDVGSPSIIG